jgi:outer membrane receptor protein involved in Fe transport
MKKGIFFLSGLFLSIALDAGASTNSVSTNKITDLGEITVKAKTLSRYRPETVNGGTFTDLPPEKLPMVVDTLTEDFIQEHNPTDLHDLLRYVPGIETGGKSLLIRQPGTFSIRGMGGTEPMFDGVMPIGRGAGLFMDAFLMERIEVVKGPIGSLNGGAGAVQNASGGGGSVNMYLKSANLEGDKTVLQGNSSIGKHTQRHRGMADVNQMMLDGKGAIRVVGTADYYEPTYINQGLQKGARPRESFSLAPSIMFAPNEDMKFGLKTLFQYTDQPSYIGVPVWRGKPAGGYSWYESSCRRGDRSTFESFMLNPWLDWQVTDDWLLKFGASMIVSSWEHVTREPYYGSGVELADFFETGIWSSGNKYMTSQFSEGSSLSRNYNLFIRSIYDKDLPFGIKNSFVVQPDYYYRESSGGFGTPTSRYGITLQDSISWEWFTILGGVRYDHFEVDSYSSDPVYKKGVIVTPAQRYWHQTADAVSPRGGISIQPLEWLVFFGNISQTRTPTLGYRNKDGSSPDEPWRATQYEGGLRLRPVEKLWLTLAAYRIEQENMPEADTETGFYTYDGRNTSRGAEVSLTGDITDNWTVMGMYAYNQYTDRNVAPGQKGRHFERYPAHTFSLNTSYRFSSGPLEDVVVGAAYRFRSMNYACMRGSYTHKNLRFDPSHIFDINVIIPFTKFGGSENWTLTLGVRNLFGEKYFESARHYYECLVGEPRTFEIGIRAEF